ncbi:hypothetical protein L6164_008497 [Bauhinia variegata]|uniref:Uncharacterized protein n=1 Tax=Bauhinia variegata TaxID=167791 RepID=A0ACB9PGQ3_BAUVA|nr:hypothetical protein L6164_008497 [Bauhinia variegata]
MMYKRKPPSMAAKCYSTTHMTLSMLVLSLGKFLLCSFQCKGLLENELVSTFSMTKKLSWGNDDMAIRENHQEEFFSKTKTLSNKQQIVVVTGASGLGKSALI